MRSVLAPLYSRGGVTYLCAWGAGLVCTAALLAALRPAWGAAAVMVFAVGGAQVYLAWWVSLDRAREVGQWGWFVLLLPLCPAIPLIALALAPAPDPGRSALLAHRWIPALCLLAAGAALLHARLAGGGGDAQP